MASVCGVNRGARERQGENGMSGGGWHTKTFLFSDSQQNREQEKAGEREREMRVMKSLANEKRDYNAKCFHLETLCCRTVCVTLTVVGRITITVCVCVCVNFACVFG